jgi:DNA (cytosine-5)-methyltransferase 1
MGNIEDVTGRDLGIIDLLVGGFPCKGISRGKGHKLGLADKDSKQFFEFVRLLRETQRILDESKPRWAVLENAADLTTSPGGVNRGWDLSTVVSHLEELGYGWAYRVVDARDFPDANGRRTPAKRTRTLVVAHRGGDPRPAGQVLGLCGPGASPAAQGDDGGPEPGPGPTPVAVGGDLVRVWRKGVNPRLSIEKGYEGGYRETWVNDGWANTLAASDGGNATWQKHLLAQAGRVRTLTPVEWERLLGFPDNWTASMPHSARYDALGNAMHVDMARWLGQRLLAVHNALPALMPSA